MERTNLIQKREGESTVNNASLRARKSNLGLSFKMALDIRLRFQSIVRIAEERLCKVLVSTFMVIGLMISIKASVSIM
ncbi:hypothetical protein [Myroides odoratimimus]|uniref:hypothetical protein n=1 Tax=Myroides odoratimimus TaxID=76832 RepID=UPI0025755B7B|nr:hypothetical protein [Myroides odoratimimus]MDM1519394.1 hypothetical protein [Myroides odoratimimus]